MDVATKSEEIQYFLLKYIAVEAFVPLSVLARKANTLAETSGFPELVHSKGGTKVMYDFMTPLCALGIVDIAWNPSTKKEGFALGTTTFQASSEEEYSIDLDKSQFFQKQCNQGKLQDYSAMGLAMLASCPSISSVVDEFQAAPGIYSLQYVWEKSALEKKKDDYPVPFVGQVHDNFYADRYIHVDEMTIKRIPDRFGAFSLARCYVAGTKKQVLFSYDEQKTILKVNYGFGGFIPFIVRRALLLFDLSLVLEHSVYRTNANVYKQVPCKAITELERILGKETIRRTSIND
ncbi:MAG: hypothetical protein WCQ66_01125 [Sphaerochaetaceae bacterium]